MDKTVSIEQANPFVNKEQVTNTIEDIVSFKSKVVFISDNRIIVALQNEETCLLTLSETEDVQGIKTDDDIDILYEENGQVIKNNSRLKTYQNVLSKVKEGQVLNATVTATTKQGLLVSVEGLQCLMSEGQIGLNKNDDLETYIDKTIEVKIISIKLKEKEGNRFLPIASHKVLEDEKNVIEAQDKLRDIKIGDIIHGTVKSFASYGVFVTIFPSVDGLIHITDLSWERVSDPSKILSIGQNVSVVILDIKHTNDCKTKISLGLKQLSHRPWERFDKNSKEGDVVSGSVCNVTDYGIFIRLPSGVQGLVHKSELSWDSKVTSRDFINGQILSSKIINIDWEKEKLLLSIKRLGPDPWETIEEKISIGDVVETTIVNFANYGVFVSLADDIEGLIHVSELSWTKETQKPKDCFSIGEHLKAVVVSIDKDNRRIGLSHKQILQNPWKNYTIGQQITVIVTEIKKQGIQVKLENDNLSAFIPTRFVPKDLVWERSCNKLNCTIQEIDENKRRMILAIV